MDRLLTKDLLHRTNDRNVHVQMDLESTPCLGKWMGCRLLLNGDIQFEGTVKQHRHLDVRYTCESDTVKLTLEIYGKGQDGTSTDAQGNIVENRSLAIQALRINGANVVENGYIFKAVYHMHIDEDKRQFFVDNGFPLSNNDHHFFEDGVWSIDFAVPVLRGIINDVRTLETYERIPYAHIMEDIARELDL
jgi:hypothetical protein